MLAKTNDFRVKTSRQTSKRPLTQTIPQTITTIKKKLSPIRINKYNVFMDCLNDLTQQKFDKCQSRILFQQIEERVKKNQLLCILFIQNVTVYSKYDLPNMKIPPKFSWEAIYRNKTLILTTPQQYTRTCHGLVDFMFKSNAKYPLKLKLLKVKNYEEQYIGEIELSVSDFVDFEVVQEYQGKMIKETFVQKEMFKVYNDQSASIGQVSLKIIQFCSSSVPSNKSSNIPGSPKTQEQRKKHQLIEDSKIKGYDWGNSTNEEILIQQILECQKEMQSKIRNNTDEIIKLIELDCDKTILLLKEIYQAEYFNTQRDLINRYRKQRKNQVEFNIIKLKQLQQQYYEIMNNIRQISRQGRIKKIDLDAILLSIGCTAQELFLNTLDDFGFCVIDYILESDSLPELLYFMNQLNLEDKQNAEQFSQSLFHNIQQRLRRNHYLKALSVLIQAFHIYPSIGLVLYQQATQPPDNFLLEFNIQDYQHVIVLSKLRKLCKKYLNMELPFMQQMEELYHKAKQETYFKIPILPKKVETQEKFDLLQLPQLQQNIFHEIVRRKRWNLFARSYKQFEQLVYQQDTQGISPMMMFLENAPLDQIIQLEQLQNQISISGQTSLHFLIMNPDLSLNSLLICINKFNILNDKVWLGYTPLALFLDRLVIKQKKHKNRIIKEVKVALENNNNKGVQVLEILNQSTIQLLKHFNINKYLLYCQNIKKDYFQEDLIKIKQKKPFQIQQQKNKQIVEWENFYYQHTVPAMILCNLDESIIELIWPQFEWVNWLCSLQNYPYETFYNYTLLNSISKTTQTQQIYQYLTKDINIIYKDNELFNDKNNNFDLYPLFQQLYQNKDLNVKLKDDIQKKYKGIIEQNKIKEEEETTKKKIKIMYQNIAIGKYTQVFDQLIQEQQISEGMLQNNFNYQGVVNDLMIAKNLNFGKFFRKAYDSKFHNMLNFVDILIKALYYNNMQAAHMALYFATLRQNKAKRVVQLKQSQQVYLQSLNTHWCIELDFLQFQAMINDIKDICQQNEVNYVILILAMNGRYNKLKLIHEKMTNQNYIIQALPIAAHQLNTVRNHIYYDGLQKLLQECDIKRLFSEDSLEFFKPSKEKEKPKPEPRKPFDKAKPVFCKWMLVQGPLTTQLQQVYKFASNSTQRVKSEQSLLSKQYQALWSQEYSYKLRRLFPKQNFRSVFYQFKPKESDFVKTIELLIEKVLQLKLTPSDDFFNYVHVHDKFSELLSQSPNQNICIVQAFKSMINLFKFEQSNEILSRCINFLKKYLNSKIYKDLNEPETFGREGSLLTNYLSKGDTYSTQCKFACEVLILMDQNFTTQEFESLNIIQQPQQLANLLLKYKTLEKRTIGFIQKYLNTTLSFYKQPLPFNDSNLKYIVDLAKQGINLISENPLDFFLSKGLYSYLKEYFMNSLKPKGSLSDDQKQYYLGYAFQSGSQETIQMCIEELCTLKNSELKHFILEGNFFAKAITKGSQETLLYITRKIFKQLQFNSKEILKLLQIRDDGIATPYQQDKRNRSLMTSIFFYNCDIFYKEFFNDYLQKILPQDYKHTMTKILNAKIQGAGNEEMQTVFQTAIQCGFFDVIQTVLQLNINIDANDLQNIDFDDLPQRWLFQTPQQLENLLKQDHYKQLYKQSALRLYRICKYHLCRQDNLKKLEISLNLAPLYNKLGLKLNSNDPIINLISNQQINPTQHPLIYLLKLHLDQVDKANSFILVESFCDKHPQITHDKVYTQLIKNREAYELLRIYYPEQNQSVNTDFNIEINQTENFAKEYLILQDPKQFQRFVCTNQQLIYSLRVLYDKNDNIEGFFESLTENQHLISAGLLLLILNPHKYQELVFNKFKSSFQLIYDASASQTTNIFRCILKYFQTFQRIFIFIYTLAQGMLNNQIYQQLVQIKPIGDMNNQINQEKQFLEDIKDAMVFDTFTLQDNVWGQIISSSSKATHTLQQDKWFNGLCLIKSLLHVCYTAESIIHDIQTLSKLDDYEKSDFWGIQDATIEIRAELHPADQVAQHKVMVFKQSEENTWKIKYPLGMIKDSTFIYPTILSQQKGTEHAKHSLIQQIYEQTKYDILPKIENFTFENYSHENIQQLIAETHDDCKITINPYQFQGDLIQYNNKQLQTNYQTKRKKKDLITVPITTNITIQVVSKEEFAKREKFQFLFNQIIEDSTYKYWTYQIDKDNIYSIKDDKNILEIYDMIKERLGAHIHLQSFIEYYFNKLATGLEKTTKKTITPRMCIDIGLQWDMLQKVTKHILQYLKFAENICFEMMEIDPRKSINFKLEGFDSIFRFGQSELQVWNNVLVVKLNLAMLPNGNFAQLLQTQSRSKQLNEIKDQIDISQYLLSVFNEQQLQVL